ncbi:MAG: hypothetical protein V4592_20115 [Bacteroidota bacterium]
MELPYSGRAVINDQFNHIEIIIPVKINWIILLAPIAFFLVWCYVGGNEVLTMIIHQSFDSWFDKVWLLWVGVSTIIALKFLWWILAGKEVIDVDYDIISIKRKGDVFARTKTYDLANAKYFRSDASGAKGHWEFGRYKRDFFAKTICFEYGDKTIKFGENLSEEEGNYILRLLKDRKLLTGKNFV